MNLLVQETRDSRVPSLGREDPLEEDMPAHASVLPESPMDRGAWKARVHGSQAPDTTERELPVFAS